jgi:hypothetical protein
MSAASGTDTDANGPGWFAERFTILADDEPLPEAPEEPPTDSPVGQAWASLFQGIRRLLPPWLGGISEPAAGPPPVSSPPKNLVQVGKLEGASKWAAAGFSSVTALLLFFGVKEGVLDQAIRLDPFATLCVFMLLGVGVLCALFASAINPVKRLHLWTLLAAIAAMLVLTAVFLPNLDFFKGAEEDVRELLPESAPDTPPEIPAKVNFWRWIPILALAVIALRMFVVRWRISSWRSRWDVALLVLSGILLTAAGFELLNGRARARVLWWEWILIVAVAFLALGVSLRRWRVSSWRSRWDVALLVLSGILLTAAGFKLLNEGARARVLFWGWILIVALAFLAFPVLFVRFRDPSTRSRWDGVFLLVSSVVLLAAAGLAIASASRQTRLSVATGALLLGATAWSFAHKSSLPAVAGIIILGVAATSLGLYGAAKVSVGTKIIAVTPQVSASLEQEGGQTFLKIVAVASRMRDAKLLISLAGTPRIQKVQARDRMVTDLRDGTGTTQEEIKIWRSVLQPNSLDEINTTLTIPLTSTRWENVTVRHHCQADEPSTGEGERSCKAQAESQDLQLGNLTPDAGTEITGHIVATSAKSLRVTLTGRNVTWGSQIQAEICRAHNGSDVRQLAFATLTPDVTGAVTWNFPVPAGGNGDELILQYRQCPPGDDCRDPDPNKLENMTQLAKYVLP